MEFQTFGLDGECRATAAFVVIRAPARIRALLGVNDRRRQLRLRPTTMCEGSMRCAEYDRCGVPGVRLTQRILDLVVARARPRIESQPERGMSPGARVPVRTEYRNN